jgi:hypothetical protein
MIGPEEDEDDQAGQSTAEAHSSGDQPDYINAAKRLEAWLAREVEQDENAYEEEPDRNENARNQLPAIGHGAPLRP